MPLTVCIGSSGSGKTTFLNDVQKSHKVRKEISGV
jgi:ABC-type lipoprotein export system ATPase subunit